MLKGLLLLLCCCCPIMGHAADKVVTKAKKAFAGNDVVAKRKALDALVSGGEDEDRLPVIIAAMKDRQVKKHAIAAMEKRTGLKPAQRAGVNPGYPGYPATRDASGWSTWWTAKQKEAADKEKLKKLEEETKAAQEKAEAAANGETVDKDKDEKTEDDGKGAEAVKKAKVPEHELYGKLDRIIFKNGNLLMCYIISKQIYLDGNLTSLDIVHRNGAGQESIDANMVSSYEEDVR